MTEIMVAQLTKTPTGGLEIKIQPSSPSTVKVCEPYSHNDDVAVCSAACFSLPLWSKSAKTVWPSIIYLLEMAKLGWLKVAI